ncbi:hypothetical protein [Emticicia sp. C21]|uniref:hypothetical protein n=1 Tax=Emticicia sp. C21 TaxID=2302915 RepID=UPI000E35430E|nr:hypothetical protein [Emticicia sp. C21]RFS13565.1 hypothetical protein D0T08_25820 [Emticicia sp. C21]
MSDINALDEELLETLKKEVAQKAGLGRVENWTQKDYEFLIFFIEEKSGVKISLTTIKRIWRNEYNRLPHIATLDALSQIAHNKDWLSLKLESTRLVDEKNSVHPAKNNHNDSSQFIGKLKQNFTYAWIIAGVALILSVGFFAFKDRLLKKQANLSAIQFSAKTSVNNSVPNTVVFTYNVDSVDARKFYIQQSWDRRRRVEVDKSNHQLTDIYYLPGYYMAKLIADDSTIREIPVHIKTNDWVVAAHQNTIENKILPTQEWLPGGIVGVGKEVLINNKIEVTEPFMLTFHNSRDFEIDGNNFEFSSDIKMDSTGIVCPAAALLIKGKHEYMYINLGAKGCESEIKMSIAERKFDGKNMDLTTFGTQIYTWQNVRVTNKNQAISIELNGKEIFKTTYTKPLGELKEVGFIFKGNGIIKQTKVDKL